MIQWSPLTAKQIAQRAAGRRIGYYFTVIIPYTEVGQTEWHPTDRTGPFKTLSGGAFPTKKQAHDWAKSHLGHTKYSVRRMGRF